MELTLDLSDKEPINKEIIFNRDVEGAAKSWVMKINSKGIFFNREAFPDSSADDFSNAVIEILENCFEVKFIKDKENLEKRIEGLEERE